jgi:hypothetical protein
MSHPKPINCFLIGAGDAVLLKQQDANTDPGAIVQGQKRTAQ